MTERRLFGRDRYRRVEESTRTRKCEVADLIPRNQRLASSPAAG